jgi:hypothetical protein
MLRFLSILPRMMVRLLAVVLFTGLAPGVGLCDLQLDFAASCYKGGMTPDAEVTICPGHNAECEIQIHNSTTSTFSLYSATAAEYDCFGNQCVESEYPLHPPRPWSSEAQWGPLGVPIVTIPPASGGNASLTTLWALFAGERGGACYFGADDCSGGTASMAVTLIFRNTTTSALETWTHTFPVFYGACTCPGEVASCPPG